MADVIDIETDPLNAKFEKTTTIAEITDLYLEKADCFHVDQSSSGQRERTEQFIKFLVALAAPMQS